MNSNKIIIALGCGFFLWGIIWSVWLQTFHYALLIVGLCLIIAGTGNSNENERQSEKLSKKARKTLMDAQSDCPHCSLSRKSGYKQCQECGKKL